jgi:hypothetical protein
MESAQTGFPEDPVGWVVTIIATMWCVYIAYWLLKEGVFGMRYGS